MYLYTHIRVHIHPLIRVFWQRFIPYGNVSLELILEIVAKCTANPIWGDIFENSFKAQSSKLERLFSLKCCKRDVRALSFEL